MGTTVEVSKETVAIVVVCTDLLVCLVLWCLLLSLRPLHKMNEQDVTKGSLLATDFTVVTLIDPHSDHINDVKPILWAWSEHILENEPDFKKYGGDDDQADKVFNVNLGLTNLAYLNLEGKMGELLQRKQRYVKMKELRKGKMSKDYEKNLDKMIKKNQDDAKDMLKIVTDMKKKSKS